MTYFRLTVRWQFVLWDTLGCPTGDLFIPAVDGGPDDMLNSLHLACSPVESSEAVQVMSSLPGPLVVGSN